MKKNQLIRLIVILVLGVAGVAGAVIYKGRQTAELEANSRARALALLSEGLTNPAEAEYLRGVIAFVHPDAWAVAFKSESLTGGTVDMLVYQREIAERAGVRAKADGQKNVSQHLDVVRQELIESESPSR